MVRTTCTYTGQKHCDLVHTPSGSQISTDAPKDNNGKGETFSPTDLVAAATASCMLTVMAIAAEKENLDLTGSHIQIDKEMGTNPRRIIRLGIEVHLPSKLNEQERKRLEVFAKACPVKQSLHPDIELPTQFIYDC